jgi:hypothetical protein
MSWALGNFAIASLESFFWSAAAVTKLVDEDFTWKDPKAAEKAGMPMMDYAIGGIDRSFS